MTTAELLFLFINSGIRLLFVALAIATLFYFHRWLDRRTERGNWAIYSTIKENPLAAAAYAGLRWVGSCLLLVGLFG